MRNRTLIILIYFFSSIFLFFSIKIILDLIGLLSQAKYLIKGERDYFNMKINLVLGFSIGYLVMIKKQFEHTHKIILLNLIFRSAMIIITIIGSAIMNFYFFSTREADGSNVIQLSDLTTLWIEFPVVIIGVLATKYIKIDRLVVDRM